MKLKWVIMVGNEVFGETSSFERDSEFSKNTLVNEERIKLMKEARNNNVNSPITDFRFSLERA